MQKLKQLFIRALNAIETVQMERARRIVANYQYGLRRWE